MIIYTQCPLLAGKYALSGLLPRAQEVALFRLFDVLSVLWRKELTVCEVRALKTQLAEALTAIELAFPVSEMDIKMHVLMHLPDKILWVGPLYITSMFAYERLYKTLKAWIGNKRYPEASIIRGFVDFQQALWYEADRRLDIMRAAELEGNEGGAATQRLAM